MTKIRDIMTQRVVTVPKEKGLAEVVKIMGTTKISSIIITQDEKIIGIITERDLIKHILMEGKSLSKVKVDEVMTKEPLTIRPDAELDQASMFMRDKNIRHLPVVDNGKLVGLITQTDIVKETHKIQRENVRFNKYQNIQVVIIVILFVFLAAYLIYRYTR
jgi:CBS domain-containing protein